MNELSWNLDDLAAVQSLKFSKRYFQRIQLFNIRTGRLSLANKSVAFGMT